jgi:transcriptional regulator with XRE-family HTH domain
MDSALINNPHMDITQILARNLSAWMEHTPRMHTIQQVAKKSGVGFGTIRRAKKGEGNITVQHLEEIAQAFGRRSVDLLADEHSQFSSAPKIMLEAREPPPADERELLQGYRDATPEVRDIMLGAARSATQKQNFSGRSETQ